jgi:hypothetical protein
MSGFSSFTNAGYQALKVSGSDEKFIRDIMYE